MQFGQDINEVYQGCETIWDEFWDWLEGAAKDLIKLAKLVCKYKPEIMILDTLVAPETAPAMGALTEGACAASTGEECFEAAKAAIDVVEDGEACLNLAYDVEQFSNDFDPNDIANR